jgi:hypothetical protein
LTEFGTPLLSQKEWLLQYLRFSWSKRERNFTINEQKHARDWFAILSLPIPGFVSVSGYLVTEFRSPQVCRLSRCNMCVPFSESFSQGMPLSTMPAPCDF